jgi:hypothetical protein
VQWTSGSVETIDISTESELFAKLPLGAASLGGRVDSGDALHMEYYVSGVRSATRASVHRNELAQNPSCADATQFVYGYNLGAFALASKSKLTSAVNGSYFGFGTGGSSASSSNAEKRGGLLSACSTDSAKESKDCRVPIRLRQRPLAVHAAHRVGLVVDVLRFRKIPRLLERAPQEIFPRRALPREHHALRPNRRAARRRGIRRESCGARIELVVCVELGDAPRAGHTSAI